MKRVLLTVLILLAALAAGLAVRTWGFTAVTVAGTSMNDTLFSGDVVLVTRFGSISNGDVVQTSFSGRGGSYIKRVIGLPGDVVEYADSALILNGRPLSEPYVSSTTENMRIALGEDEYFLLGDNRAESYDSRAEDMGCVSRSQISGRVQWILWPVSRFGPVE